MNTTDDLGAIGLAVQAYFEGMHFGDTTRLRSVVSPDAFVAGFYHGEYMRQSVDEWMAEVEGLDKPSENGEQFDMRIIATDVTAHVATVKTAALYLGLRFTDYLTLVDQGDGWKIVHKSYTHDQ